MFYKSLILSLFLFFSSLQADYITEYKMGDEIQKFMYRDASHSKMVNRGGDEKSEIYRVGKKVYIVSGSDGDKQIIDVDDMKAMSRSMGFDASAYAKDAKEEAKNYKISKTGKRVSVGGVRGELFVVTGTHEGKPYKQEIVMTNNKDVVKSVRAMFSLFSAMSTMNDSEDLFEVKKGYVPIKSDGMELKSFKSVRIAKSEYELPNKAKKQSIPTKQTLEKSQNTQDTDAQQDTDVGEAINMLKSFF
ncbi:hypothetical protein [Sulfurimonas sp.]|uniref:hypothetical protein n=1 Tax=Sulfurimonas sp. TaxID=2022749 RepID=UPI0035677DE7